VDELNLTADLKKERLQFWLRERQGDLSVLAANEHVRRDLSRLVKGVRDYQKERPGKGLPADPLSMPEFLRLQALLGVVVENYESIEAVHAVDPASGVIVVSSDTGLSGRALPDKEPLDAVLRSSTGTGVWVLPGGENQKESYLKFAGVVWEEKDGGIMPMAVLIARVGIDEFVLPMLYTGEGMEKTGEVVLVDHGGRILAPLKYPLPGGREARVLEHRIEVLPVSLAAKGKEGILFSEDYRGVPVLAAHRHLRVDGGIGWGMVVKQDMSEILEPLWRRIIVSSLVGVVGILAVLAGSALLARRLGAPLRTLAQTASAVREGDFSVRAKETGTREVYQLAGIFNSMAEWLENWNQEMEREITQKTRQLAEELEARRQSEARYRALIESSSEHLFMLNSMGEFIASNDRVSHFGLTNGSELVGKTLKDVYPPDVLETYEERLEEVLRTAQPVTFEHDLSDPSGRKINHLDTLYPIMRDKEIYAVGGICKDITELKKAQAQFLQAQKMEVVGRLVGGVAHDFNNMLSVILGYTDIAMLKLDPADPVLGNLKEVKDAARRSADLVRQLLAFSRHQVISPKPMDLNEVMKNMERLLQRLLGEDIDLAFVLAPDLWAVLMDPAQVDQIVANLAVNSRDAMPDGGKLTVETGNVTFDEAYCEGRLGFVPGEYVMLAISDTGHGMDKETLEKVFEPFYTTKGEGMGTGLGLSTVYGIVKQNNGFINVYSEPGEGTTVRVYMPRCKGEDKAEGVAVPEGEVSGGRETILIVEDQEQVRQLARGMLQGLGYQILEAGDGGDALAICERHAGDIHLLLTDVVLPTMNGKELETRICAQRPGIKVLFMSGYTANAISHRGVLDEGVHFLQKPFTLETLARKVREALDTE
ncbi:MAG: ATP-binding protein, partial [Pseudomonadota bacterium]